MTNAELTAFCKALSHETRQPILGTLRAEGGKCVGYFVDLFNLAQPTISHHLNFLRQANLVTSRKECKQIYYRLNDSNIIECCGMLFTKFVPTELVLTTPTGKEGAPEIS